MGKFIDLTGQKFHMLTVLYRAEEKKNGQVCWVCRCDCGNEKVCVGNKLKNGRTKSCGCSTNTLTSQSLMKKNSYIYEDDYIRVFDSKGESFLIEEEDLRLIKDRYWLIAPNRYVIDKDKNYLHRLIMNASERQLVDHRDGDTTDNRRSMMRLVDNDINTRNVNVQKNNKSTGVLGVYKKRNRFTAQIMRDGKLHRLGSFETIEEAIQARKDAEIKLSGELAYFWKGNK